MGIYKPLHPGLIVKETLIDATGLTVTEAAAYLGVARPTLSRLLNGHASISPEMALRLSKFLQTSIEMWMNLQSEYDLGCVQQKSHLIKIKPFQVQRNTN